MRAKIILPNLLAVLFLGISAYFYLSTTLRAQADEKLKKDLDVVSSLFYRSEQLRGFEQLSEVRRLSMSKSISDVFDELKLEVAEGEDEMSYDGRMREAWFKKALKAVEMASVQLAQRGRTPALVFVTDRHGVVLARNTTPNACPAGRNVAAAMNVVQRALDGEASYSFWSITGSPFDKNAKPGKQMCSLMNTGLLEISAAPIWGGDNQVAGAMVVGYEVSNGMAIEKSNTLGLALAVLHGTEVYSTSFTTDTAREDLNRGIQQSTTLKKIKKAFGVDGKSGLFSLEVEGNTYTALATPVPSTAAKDEMAFVFMGALEESYDFKTPLFVMLAMVLVALFAVVFIGVALSNYFIRPVVAIEEGLLKIINGEYDYRFDVESEEVGGLSYRINQLVNVFTEQEEASEEDS